MENRSLDPTRPPGPPEGALRTRESSWRDNFALILLVAMILAMILPGVVAAILD